MKVFNRFLALFLLGSTIDQYHRRHAVNAFMIPSKPLLTAGFSKVQTISSSFPSTTLHAFVPNNDDDKDAFRKDKESTNDNSMSQLSPLPINDNANSVMSTTSDDGASQELVETEDAASAVAISNVWNARLLLIGAAALYGTNFSLVKLLGDAMPEGVSMTIRFAMATAVTVPWLFEGDVFDTVNGGIDPDILTATWLGFEVGLWNSIGYIAQAVGLETTQASKSAFICSLAVVVVPLLNFFSGDKKIETRQWIGAILAVVGVGFLELAGGGGAAAATVQSLPGGVPVSTGDLLSLVQPLAFGMGFWKVEKALHQYPSEARRLTAAQLLAVFVASLCYGWSAIDASTLAGLPWSKWLASPMILLSLFWTGVITTALTIYMENKAMETLSAAEATVIFATEPLWGTAFAALVMGEQLGVNSAIGAAFIMSACFYSNLGKDGITRATKQINESARTVPAKLQNQWASFATSAAASWASWNVAVANAADKLPEMEELDETLDALGNVVDNIIDNLPW